MCILLIQAQSHLRTSHPGKAFCRHPMLLEHKQHICYRSPLSRPPPLLRWVPLKRAAAAAAAGSAAAARAAGAAEAAAFAAVGVLLMGLLVWQPIEIIKGFQ